MDGNASGEAFSPCRAAGGAKPIFILEIDIKRIKRQNPVRVTFAVSTPLQPQPCDLAQNIDFASHFSYAHNAIRWRLKEAASFAGSTSSFRICCIAARVFVILYSIRRVYFVYFVRRCSKTQPDRPGVQMRAFKPAQAERSLGLTPAKAGCASSSNPPRG